MNIIYVAHPLTENAEENIKQTTELLKKLETSCTDKCFISPIHCFNYGTALSERELLARCFEILSRSDEIWVFGDVSKSVGCQAEMAFATWKKIKILSYTGCEDEY